MKQAVGRVVMAMGAICVLVLGITSTAGAHTGTQSYLYLDVTDSTLGGRVEMPFADVRSVLGLVLEGGADEVQAELDAGADDVRAYVDAHFSIGSGVDRWPVELEAPTIFLPEAEEESDQYVVVSFDVSFPGAQVPREFEVTFDPFLDEIDGREALLLIGNDWRGGVIENSSESIEVFTTGNRTHSVDLGDTGWHKTFTASIELGARHIEDGPDHIFFVLVLLLPSVLVYRAAWRPARGFGSALWRILEIVTMFTIAHSITFTLAGLDVLPLPPAKLIESVIAASIAAAALHNIRPIAPNKEWIIAFVFGLFHGMGFASLVEDLDVSRSTQLISLLGRNIGIELAQALIVVLVFPGLFLLRRTVVYRPFFLVSSIVLAAVSVGWMFERIFEEDLGIAKVVDPLVKFPRVLLAVAAFTIVAGLLHELDRRRGRLLPVDDEPAAGRGSAGDDLVEQPATV